MIFKNNTYYEMTQGKSKKINIERIEGKTRK